MDKRSRYYFYNWQDADFKYYLFHKIVIFQQRRRAIAQRLGKIEPWNQPRRQVQNIGNLDPSCHKLAPCIKHPVKHDPIHHHRHHRLYKCPDHSKIRTGISFFKIVFRQLPDQPSALVKLLGENRQPVIKNTENNTGKCDQQTGHYLFHHLRRLIRQRIMMEQHYCRQ